MSGIESQGSQCGKEFRQEDLAELFLLGDGQLGVIDDINPLGFQLGNQFPAPAKFGSF